MPILGLVDGIPSARRPSAQHRRFAQRVRLVDDRSAQLRRSSPTGHSRSGTQFARRWSAIQRLRDGKWRHRSGSLMLFQTGEFNRSGSLMLLQSGEFNRSGFLMLLQTDEFNRPIHKRSPMAGKSVIRMCRTAR